MSSSPFMFPTGDGRQSLHDMSVQSRRAEREIPASVRDSLLPIIPRFTMQTKTYDRVDNKSPEIWRSDSISVPYPGSDGLDVAFAGMDGTAHLEDDTAGLLSFQILRNGMVAVECGAQDLYDVFGSSTPHQYGMWAGPVSPGDVFFMRAAQTNGDDGLKALSTGVRFYVATIHFKQSDIS
ncbi:MAG: hypothetical protein M3Z40_07645 [Bifidobacterium sp.]|nr:hypothetical protein [Bifidobacterium sp.]